MTTNDTNALARAFDAGKYEAALRAEPLIEALADLAFGWQSHAPAETIDEVREMYEGYIEAVNLESTAIYQNDLLPSDGDRTDLLNALLAKRAAE